VKCKLNSSASRENGDSVVKEISGVPCPHQHRVSRLRPGLRLEIGRRIKQEVSKIIGGKGNLDKNAHAKWCSFLSET
jgi:hypothetical protein